MYDVCTQIIHIQHTRMICDYFWPSFCCKIRHDDHGLVKRFRPPFFSAVLVPLPISKPGGLGWFALGSCSDCTPGQGSWALICSETTRISLVSRFWSALMWSIFMAFLRTWASDPRKRSWFTPAHCTCLQTLSAHFSLRIGEPPLQYPFNFFTCRMAGQQCCTAAPSAPKRARGLSCVVFLPYGIVMDRNYRIVR